MKRPMITTISASVCLMCYANAATLAYYDFQEGGDSSRNEDFDTASFDSVDTDVSTTASRLFQAGSLTGGGANAFIVSSSQFAPSDSGSPGLNVGGVATGNVDLARTAGDFFSFSMTSGGSAVTYDSIDFYSNRSGGAGQFAVSYSVNGAAEVFVAQDIAPPGFTDGVSLPVAHFEYDFLDFTTAEEVQWNFYAYQAPNANNALRFDDIKLTGVVPEPSSAALLGLGGIALILRRRKG